MLINLSRPAIIAHRGASWDAPENTLAAFQLAVQEGADAVELDVKLSLDGYPVVIHDSTVDRTTNGTGRVAALKLEELQRLDARGKFAQRFPPQKIPTLGDVLTILESSIDLNLELTNYQSPWDNLPETVVKMVKQRNLEKMVHYSSFNPIALFWVRRLEPEASLGLLARHGAFGAWARSKMAAIIPHHALHPDYRDATPELANRVNTAGKRLFPYTVNRDEEIRAMFHLGAHGIFTDRPHLAREILNTDGSPENQRV